MVVPIPSNPAVAFPERHPGSIPLCLARGRELLHCGARGNAVSTVSASHLIGGDPVLVALADNTIGKDTNMTAFVRLGGIAAFIAALGFMIFAGFGMADVTYSVLEKIIASVMVGCIPLAFWTTKTLFNSHDYRRADIALWGIVALCAVILLHSVLGEFAGLDYHVSASVAQIIHRSLLGVGLALSILFAIQAMGFAPRGGGVWKAIGILYLANAILGIFLLAAKVMKLDTLSAFLDGVVLISVLVWSLVLLASLIVHGIGLVSGAGKTLQAATA